MGRQTPRKASPSPKGHGLGAIGSALHALDATSYEGFEGLIARLLAAETGLPFRVAGAGRQDGLDLATERGWSCAIAVECKRFGKRTPIPERELEAEIQIACRSNPELDLWVLATTRPVTTQEDAAIERSCRDHGIAHLSLWCEGEEEPGTLDVLCSRHWSLVSEFLASRLGPGAPQLMTADRAATRIGLDPRTPGIASSLAERLRLNSVGLAALRARLDTALADSFSDRMASRRRFGCPLHVRASAGDEPIRRMGVHDALSCFWRNATGTNEPALLVVEGREGDGKSWATADWVASLLTAADSPVVFFIRAQEPSSREALAVLAQHAARYAPLPTVGTYERRLRRWMVPTAGRRLLVVLDGINERHDPGLWAPLINEMACLAGTAVVVTCRSETWHSSYEDRIWIPCPSRVVVGGFDDVEFARAIASLPEADRQRLMQLGPLVRRPRFFALAVQHLSTLLQSGDLTIARLYFEDWRDRLRQRPDLPLDRDDFDAMLRRHAAALLARSPDQPDRQITGLFERLPDMLEELTTGGVMRKGADGSLHVEPEYLALGLGLVLADRAAACAGDVDAKLECIETLLGDTAEFDLTADVCERAVLQALSQSATHDHATAVSLLLAWTRCQNTTQRAIDDLPRYAALRPDVVCDLAEQIWLQDRPSAAVQRAIRDALVRIVASPRTAAVLVDRFTEWTGLVHPHGERDSGADEDGDGKTPFDAARLIPVPGGTVLFESSGITLRHTERQHLLPLGRLALAVISTTDRRALWPALVCAEVANEAMGGCRSELIAWVIRTSKQPLSDLVADAVHALRLDRDVVCARAARRLAQYLGESGLIDEPASLPPDLFSRNAIREEYLEDPCLSIFFAPSIEQLPECLERSDVPTHFKLERAAQVAADLSFTFPKPFVDLVEGLARSFDMSKLRRTMSAHREDMDWESLQPLLCRINPDLHQAKVREFAIDAPNRSGQALRQFALEIHRYGTLLSPAESAALRSRWEALVATPVPWSDDVKLTEGFLLLALLPTLTGQEQLQCLLRRPDDAHDMVRMTSWFAVWTVDKHPRWSPGAGSPREPA